MSNTVAAIRALLLLDARGYYEFPLSAEMLGYCEVAKALWRWVRAERPHQRPCLHFPR